MHKFSNIKAYILLTALVLLLLPNLLFLIGWFRPYIAIPFCCLLFFSVLMIWYSSKTTYLPTSSVLKCSRLDIVKLIACLTGALILIETISFHGHFYQSCDFFVRNPIYQSLIDKPWPIYNVKGEYFVYYHAFWLPPALIAKHIGCVVSPATILFLWAYLYISTGIILLFCKIKGRVLTFFIILVMIGTIAPEFAQSIVLLSKSCCQPLSTWLCRYGVCGDDFIRYVPFWESCRLSFNVSLPGFLCLSVLFSGLLPKRYWCVPAAFIVQPALLCAIALFLWLMLCLLRNNYIFKDALFCPHTWACIVFVLLIVLYFSCLASENSTNGIHVVCPIENSIDDGRSAINRTVRTLLLPFPLIISLYYVIDARLRRNSTFIGGCIVSLVISFIWIGMRNNELLFKGGLVVYFLFSWNLTVQWFHSSKKHKILITIFLLLSASHLFKELFLRHALHDYGWSREKIERHINDPYQGTVDNMSGFIHDQFFAKNRFPLIFVTRPST